MSPDDSPTSQRLSRRRLLRQAAAITTGGVAGAGSLSAVTGASTAAHASGEQDVGHRDPVHDQIPTTPAEMRAAFDEVPHLSQPTPADREHARMRYPDAVVPDEGPVPDPRADARIEVRLETPAWVLASAYAEQRPATDPSADAVRDWLLSLCWADEQWVLPDGRDAVDAIMAALQEDER